MAKKRTLKRKTKSKNSLVMFSIPGCPYCQDLKKSLKKAKISFKTIDCNKSSLTEELGITAVPVLAIKSKDGYRKIGQNITEIKKEVNNLRNRNPGYPREFLVDTQTLLETLKVFALGEKLVDVTYDPLENQYLLTFERNNGDNLAFPFAPPRFLQQ